MPIVQYAWSAETQRKGLLLKSVFSLVWFWTSWVSLTIELDPQEFLLPSWFVSLLYVLSNSFQALFIRVTWTLLSPAPPSPISFALAVDGETAKQQVTAISWRPNLYFVFKTFVDICPDHFSNSGQTEAAGQAVVGDPPSSLRGFHFRFTSPSYSHLHLMAMQPHVPSSTSRYHWVLSGSSRTFR